MFRLIWLTLFGLLGHLTTALAQDSAALAGLREVQLVVEDPTDVGRSCGLTSATLQASFVRIAASTKLRIVPTSTTAFIIGVTTARSKSGACASAGVLKLATIQSTVLKYSGKETFSQILLWSDYWVDLTDQPSTHSSQVQRSVQNSTQSFLNEWISANPP